MGTDTEGVGTVAFINVGRKKEVQAATAEAMVLSGWREKVRGASFFLKVNLLSKEVVPGQCTSPWVFEGVLRSIRDAYPRADIWFGDSDVATAHQLNDAVRAWGFDRIGREYDAEFVNLSETETVEKHIGEIFNPIDLPRLLLDIDSIITIPVVKTHCLTPFTGALKNQWGLLPRARFKYHPIVHKAIAEINAFFRPQITLGVADVTVAMEGPGPRVGIPKICNAVMASTDPVALDSAIAIYMGIDPADVGFIEASERAGVGTGVHTMSGDPFYVNAFKPGEGKDYFVYRWRDRIGEVPYLGRFVLENSLPFRFFGVLALLYYRHVWYNRYGRGYARNVCRNPLYHREFGPLLRAL